MRARHAIVASILAVSASTAPVLLAEADSAALPSHAVWEVSVTNITRGQILSPSVVVTHAAGLRLFTLGQPASPELAMVAEDAVLDPLMRALASNRRVRDVQVLKGAQGPIMPGETAKIRVRGDRHRHGLISVVGMLVTTNDAFYAVNGAAAPRRGTRSLRSPAYDAGSEANNEKCAFIPGPPCGNPGKRQTQGAEGYVHIHAGIHGIGDLKPSMHDWRDKVAAVSIRRVR